ncbi:hypothetical protein Q9233_017597 [Columba guinea]|nr:hypothetical protein Q9233_017597 [Columba guinea]
MPSPVALVLQMAPDISSAFTVFTMPDSFRVGTVTEGVSFLGARIATHNIQRTMTPGGFLTLDSWCSSSSAPDSPLPPPQLEWELVQMGHPWSLGQSRVPSPMVPVEGEMAKLSSSRAVNRSPFAASLYDVKVGMSRALRVAQNLHIVYTSSAAAALTHAEVTFP